MAGHSQFKNIMHRKGRQDAVRSKVFSKLAREITVSAKLGLPDPTHNPRLRAAILAARKENMPKDNIERAIKKASEAGGENYEEVRYEGFGPAGVAVIVEALTDNRNRTAGDVRAIFSKNGGNLGESGSVAFMFDRLGSLWYPKDAGTDEAMLERAIEAGASEVVSDGEGHEFLTSVEDFGAVRDALEAALGPAEESGIIWKPQTLSPLDAESGAGLMKLMSALDDHDDVQNVYANVDMNDSALA